MNQWHELMKMYFNVPLKTEEAVAWFTEMRLGVRGWKHDLLTEPADPTKGKRASEINEELCDVLRYIAELDHVPRKSEGGRKDYHGKPTVKDVILWVWIYRKNQNQMEGVGVDKLFVDTCTRHIRRLVQEGRGLEAAILSQDPCGVDDCVEEIMAVGGNRGYTEFEQSLVFKYCSDIHFNIKEAFDEAYYERFGGRPAVAAGEIEEDLW